MRKIIALALCGFVSSLALAQSLPSQAGTTQMQQQRYSVPAAKASTKKSKSLKLATKRGKHAKKSGKVKAKSGHGKVKAKSAHKVH
ncbi:hypothetical protein [Roseateles oligotrophus]|uniref:Acid-shock protein n=1 Tax=Roseateles oligotrophus TaxID=1769250 RepID=A0ABT2YA36_9BURK|nr:hypothetical protein [Roseateles oligotrophus]MCV2367167.1 hypothetical protein [Roseateles oligotrophus]